jgi:UDP-glucose 4-epimerase
VSQKHILITGGAGFIGSHLAGYHLEKGDQVWVVDNLQSGRLNNLALYSKSPSLRFDQACLCQWTQLPEAVKWADRIYHLAAHVGQRMVLAKACETLSNNIRSCEILLQTMEQTNSSARLLIASSSEVYAHCPEEEQGNLKEDLMIHIPSEQFLQTTYPASKLINEIMALAYVSQKGLDCTIARLFNTIGINQSPAYGMVVPAFIQQALAGAPLTVYGDGQQSRSFTNVHDTIEALDLLLNNPESKGQIVNIGNNQECTILQLAELVRELTKSSSKIVYVPYKQAYGVDFKDVKRRRPNLEKLIHLTGFHPKCSLKQTIQEIIHPDK